MSAQNPVVPILFLLILFILSLTTPWYVTVFLALYGLWNPRLRIGTLVILAILDCLFGVARVSFFQYPGVLFLGGAVCFLLFAYIRSQLATHVLE